MPHSQTPNVIPQSSGPSTADEIVEQGYRSLNDSITRMFTRVLERNPGADLGDVLQMALAKYSSLRHKVEERPQKRQRKGPHLFSFKIWPVLTPDAVSSSRRNIQG